MGQKKWFTSSTDSLPEDVKQLIYNASPWEPWEPPDLSDATLREMDRVSMSMVNDIVKKHLIPTTTIYGGTYTSVDLYNWADIPSTYDPAEDPPEKYQTSKLNRMQRKEKADVVNTEYQGRLYDELTAPLPAPGSDEWETPELDALKARRR